MIVSFSSLNKMLSEHTPCDLRHINLNCCHETGSRDHDGCASSGHAFV